MCIIYGVKYMYMGYNSTIALVVDYHGHKTSPHRCALKDVVWDELVRMSVLQCKERNWSVSHLSDLMYCIHRES